LAGNALRHGRPPARVRLLRVDGGFIVDVADQDRETNPRADCRRAHRPRGRGLHIARPLAEELCWYTTEHVKHLWASFPADPSVDQDAAGDL
jgi:hypothetical protein